MRLRDLFQLHAASVSICNGASDVLAATSTTPGIDLCHTFSDGLHNVRAEAFNFLDELPDFLSDYLIDG